MSFFGLLGVDFPYCPHCEHPVHADYVPSDFLKKRIALLSQRSTNAGLVAQKWQLKAMEEAFLMCTRMKTPFLKTIFSSEHEKAGLKARLGMYQAGQGPARVVSEKKWTRLGVYLGSG